MKLFWRLAVGLVGIFNAMLGLGFLFSPAKLASAFALMPSGAQGLATLRADFPAFFLTGALFSLLGAWRGQAAPLRVPLVLLSIALVGRFVSIAFDGASQTTALPMIAEATMIAILALAYRAFNLQTKTKS